MAGTQTKITTDFKNHLSFMERTVSKNLRSSVRFTDPKQIKKIVEEIAGTVGRDTVLALESEMQAPPCWWIDHGGYGQITQREDEATRAVAEGKRVVSYVATTLSPLPEKSGLDAAG